MRSTYIATPYDFRRIHKIYEHQPERRSANNPAHDLSTVWIADENMQGHPIRISHRRIVEGAQPVADDPLGIRLRCAGHAKNGVHAATPMLLDQQYLYHRPVAITHRHQNWRSAMR